jgi:hypothetical protein
MMGDPVTNGSLFIFGDEGPEEKRGVFKYAAMLRGRNFWAKLDTVMVSGGSFDWNIADEIDHLAVQSWNQHKLTSYFAISKTLYCHMKKKTYFLS